MKKIIFLVFSVFLIFSNTLSYAQSITTNVFASWISVGKTQKTVNLPHPSRHLNIINGATNCVNSNYCTVWVSPVGDDIVIETPNTLNYRVFQLPVGEQLNLYDFVTTKITFKTSGLTASPISVISTY